MLQEEISKLIEIVLELQNRHNMVIHFKLVVLHIYFNSLVENAFKCITFCGFEFTSAYLS